MSDINKIKEGYSAGDKMTLTVYRSGKTKDIEITLMDESDLTSTTKTTQEQQEGDSNGAYGYGNPYSGYGYGYGNPFGY